MFDCTESVYGIHDADRHGRCHWCRRKVEAACAAPERYPTRSDLADAYGMFYDPDYDPDYDEPRKKLGYLPWR